MREDAILAEPDAVSKPLVALVGRPNVGKSALFNRMVGNRRAIVEDIPGTTRDRLVEEVEWRGRYFDIVDTGGVSEPTSVAGSGAYMDEIRSQVTTALKESLMALFLVDAKSGITAADYEVAEILRRSGVATILVANKADNIRRSEQATEFFELGLGEPQAVSALNGGGVGELLDSILDGFPRLPDEDAIAPAGLKIALIGRPNVGKSALANAILGEDRVIVSDIAGTTRDAIDSPFAYEGEAMTLIDTAGIRRPGRIEGSIEHYSVVRSRQAVDRADVSVVVFDASQRLRAQDLHVVGLALEHSTGVVLCGNKWDLMRDETDRAAFVGQIRRRLRFATWIPLVLTSAIEGEGIDNLLTEVRASGEERRKRVQTSELNAAIRGAMAKRPPPAGGHRRLKLLYVTQAGIQPPTFVFFTNDASLLRGAYQRYLENVLRAKFGFRGAGLRMIFRSRAEE